MSTPSSSLRASVTTAILLSAVSALIPMTGCRAIVHILIEAGRPDPDEPGDDDRPAARGPASATSCGIRVRVLGGSHQRVRLELENVSDESQRVGSSMQAAFVDASGAAMTAEMDFEDGWFMPISLPAHSHVVTEVGLSGGDAARLDRIEIPNSGGAFCTIRASGLATP